jgi:[acyl-carrier-protein] S-malonyltransferase
MTSQQESRPFGEKIAFVFPGQGSQSIGMGRSVAESFESARHVFAEADAELGFSLSSLCFEGPDDQLALTANTQPAILTASIAVLRAAQAAGCPSPDFVAGHSLGEYSALVAAGGISFTDAVRTVRQRGSFMQDAVPVGIGAMAAILGAPLETIQNACDEAAQGQVCSAANINSPNQIVIAGDSDAVARAIELLKERGAKKALPLNVSAPFHCALMMPAQIRLEEVLNEVSFSPLTIPLVENVSGKVNTDPARAKAALIDQVSSPVRWAQSVENMINDGVGTFVEIGPGKVLCGLVRQINRDVRCLNISDEATLREVLGAL